MLGLIVLCDVAERVFFSELANDEYGQRQNKARRHVHIHDFYSFTSQLPKFSICSPLWPLCTIYPLRSFYLFIFLQIYGDEV